MSGYLSFEEYGLAYYLRIYDAASLFHAIELDEVHWAVLSAPLEVLHLDNKLLEYIDTDKDQRLTVSEFKQALVWLKEHLKDTSGIDVATDALMAKMINPDAPQGQAMIGELNKLQNQAHEAVGLKQLRETISEVEKQSASDTGVILSHVAGDNESLHQQIDEAVTITGGATHSNGEQGLDQATLEAYLKACEDAEAWRAQREDEAMYVLGDQTATGYDIYAKSADMLDRFFAQCEAVTQDPSLKTQLWPWVEGQAPAAGDDGESIRSLIAAAPIAEPNSEGRIDFEKLNPAYHEQLWALKSSVIEPLLGEIVLMNLAQWQDVKSRLSVYANWVHATPHELFTSDSCEICTAEQRETFAAAVSVLITAAQATRLELSNLEALEKLALYQANMLRLANNFISLSEVYEPGKNALFDQGALIMDGRRFNLAIPVPNRAAHVKAMKQGNTFVLYVHIEHTPSDQKREVVVPVTSGTRGNLYIGQHGIFEHVDGKQWTAKVVDIVDRPVSLIEAIFDPFRRLGTMITSKIEAVTKSAEKDLEKTSGSAVTDIHSTTKTTTTTPAKPAPVAPAATAQPSGGMLAGGGLAIAAIGSSGAFIVSTFAKMQWWEILGSIFGALMVVLVPTIVLAMIRLNQRDIRNLLEGSSFSINLPMRLTLAQRRYFAQKMNYPAGSEFRKPWYRTALRVILVIVLLICAALWSYIFFSR